MELDLGQRSPVVTEVGVPERLANDGRGLDNVTSAEHMLEELVMDDGRSKTCSC